MAFKNEEDYLDNLLKSISDQNDSSMQEDLFNTDSSMQVPETFETSQMIESDDSIYEQMLFNAVNNNVITDEISESIESDTDEPQVDLFENVEPQAPKYEDVVSQDAVFDNLVSQEEVSVDAYEEDFESEDDLVDEYIKKVLSLDEEFVPEVSDELMSDEMVSEESFSDNYVEDSYEMPVEQPQEVVQEEETHYIDITNDDFFEAEDLISQLDGIINNVTTEIEEEQQEEISNEAEKSDNSISEEESVVDISELQVDDELKELLGIGDEQPEMIQEDNGGLSEGDMQHIANIEAEVDAEEVEMPLDAMELDIEEEEADEGLAQLLNMVAESGIDDNDDSETASLYQEGKERTKKKKEKKQKSENNSDKESLVSKFLALFKKKEKTSEDVNVNENQQVLDSLFDENGELVGEKKKAKKKGLFSKTPKISDSMVEISTNISDIEEFVATDLSSIPVLEEAATNEKKGKKKKEKVKKTKEKKEKKAKKVKKQVQPKIKKIKQPVDPQELIKIKPGAVIFMLVVVAVISAGAYLFIKMFSYNQSLDSATYYLVDKKYTFAYEAIAGIEPTADEDKALIEQIETIMFVQKEYNSHERYVKMNMQFEALDSLIKGIAKYDENINKAVEIGVGDDIENVKALIVNTLWQQYGITEDMARSYGLITDYEQYVYILESYGGRIDDSNN